MATDRLMNSTGFLVHGESMHMTQCDKKGRLQISQAVRSRYGDKFLILEGDREVILRPIPRDPLQDLREWGRPLQHLSIEELKRHIDEQADKEVEETLNRLGMKRVALEQEHSRVVPVDEHRE
jgi:hypothetical protein